jgi:hypothetical protein
MFPNKYAKWRLVEIKSFIDEFKCDILCVSRINSYANMVFDFDWDLLKDQFNLDEYDILIFNPQYNYVNKYNNSIDGTIYNGMLNADYMLRHKTKRSQLVNLDTYDLIYHIFLMCYESFNRRFKFSHNKQIIHLYPGGGYLNSSYINIINKEVKLISTQRFISENIKNNTYIEIFGGPFYYKNEENKAKIYSNSNLCICFTSMGYPVEKGAYIYHKIVKDYKIKYPNDNIKFISVGSCPPHEDIKSFVSMDQMTLSKFYKDNVDILISLDTGVALNGFPLGVEAMQEGCIVLTTDIHNQNILNNFNIDPFYIINKHNTDEIIDKIKSMTDNKFLQKKSIELQEKIYELFNYNNTMGKIFKFILA